MFAKNDKRQRNEGFAPLSLPLRSLGIYFRSMVRNFAKPTISKIS